MPFKSTQSHQTSISLFAVTAFSISLTLSGCTPERRAMLRVTAENFRNQAVEAITSFREINQLQFRDSATDNLESTNIEILKNPILENKSQLFQQLNLIILRDKNQPSKFDTALDNLQTEYDKAVEIFTNLEEKEMIKLTMSKLILAADKGQRISKLIDEYPNLSFEVISAKITQILGLTSNITGKDYSSLTSKIKTIEQEVTRDKTLNELFTNVINTQSKPDKSHLKCQF